MNSRAEQLRIVASAYAAFGHGDLERLLSLLSPDVIWDATGALWERGLYKGHLGVRAYFARLDRMWDQLRLADYDIEVTGPNNFVVRGRLRGYAQGSAEDAPFTHRIEVSEDATISRLEIVVERDAV